MKNFIKENSTWIIAILIALIVGLTAYFNYQLNKKPKGEKIEYTDTTGTYHQIYYETKFKELKKTNKQLTMVVLLSFLQPVLFLYSLYKSSIVLK